MLLVNEAEIFLEERDNHSLQRNALVSIFLRILEYFQGILFLTTNRVMNFDKAFRSRIALGLKYNELNTDARNSIWKIFIHRLGVSKFSEENYVELSGHELNGREVR